MLQHKWTHQATPSTYAHPPNHLQLEHSVEKVDNQAVNTQNYARSGRAESPFNPLVGATFFESSWLQQCACQRSCLDDQGSTSICTAQMDEGCKMKDAIKNVLS